MFPESPMSPSSTFGWSLCPTIFPAHISIFSYLKNCRFVLQFFLHTFQTLQVGCLVFVNGCMFEFVLVTICAQKGEDLMSGEVVFNRVLPHILISHISLNLIGLGFPCIQSLDSKPFIVDRSLGALRAPTSRLQPFGPA